MSRFHPRHPEARRTSSLRVPAGLLLSLLALACGQSPTEPPEPPVTPPPQPANMDGYLANLPSWAEFSPLLADFDGPVGDPTPFEEMVDGRPYQCTATPHSLTRTPEKVVTLNPDVEILYPGSLLQGSGYVGGIGSLAELPVRQRAPITLSIDLLTDGNLQTVEAPTLGSVTQAVGSLVEDASDAGHRAGSKIFFNQVEYHALSEASVRAGLSAMYQGVTVKANLETSFTATRSTVMAVYTQQMFTVSIELPQTPGALFSDAFTEELLQEQVALGRIGPDNLPVFVSSVVYGRMVVFSLSAEGTAAEIKGALSIAAGEVGGELSAEQRALLETSEIQLVAIGGDAAQAAAVIRSGDFADYFDEDADLTTARPISYTVRNVADNSIAQVSETSEYTVRECAAPPATGRRYRIEMIDVDWVERRSPVCVPWPTQFLVSSDFYVEDANAVTQVVDETGGGALTVSGGAHQYPANGVEVVLHYDGRDQVRIFGDVWTVYPNHFAWNPGIQFRRTIPTGTFGSSRWNEGAVGCNRFLIRYRVIGMDEVYD